MTDLLNRESTRDEYGYLAGLAERERNPRSQRGSLADILQRASSALR